MKFIGRKFVALLLAVMMTLSLGVSANAAEPANYDDYIKVTDESLKALLLNGQSMFLRDAHSMCQPFMTTTIKMTN